MDRSMPQLSTLSKSPLTVTPTDAPWPFDLNWRLRGIQQGLGTVREAEGGLVQLPSSIPAARLSSNRSSSHVEIGEASAWSVAKEDRVVSLAIIAFVVSQLTFISEPDVDEGDEQVAHTEELGEEDVSTSISHTVSETASEGAAPKISGSPLGTYKWSSSERQGGTRSVLPWSRLASKRLATGETSPLTEHSWTATAPALAVASELDSADVGAPCARWCQAPG